MKVFYIDPMSYNNLSKYDKSLLENISKFDKYFFCSNKIEYNNIKYTNLNMLFKYNDKKGISKVFSYLISSIRVANRIRIERPKIVHYQWFKLPYFDFILIYIIRKVFKVKVVFTAHNLLPHNSGMKYFKIFKMIYLTIDAIIVHSERTKQELIEVFNTQVENIYVIPHGVLESAKDSNCSFNDIISRQNNTKKDTINYSFLGYLSHYKGIDLLIQSWLNSEILNTSSNLHLTIAGKGDVDFMGIDKFENVTIINKFLNEEEFNNIIEMTDVVVMPYRKISQSGVLLSILEKRKPILVSDVGGLTEPFLLGDVGWVLEKVTANDLQLLLEKISKQSEKIYEIKNNDLLWKKIRNYYDWSIIGEKTQALYEKVIDL